MHWHRVGSAEPLPDQDELVVAIESSTGPYDGKKDTPSLIGVRNASGAVALRVFAWNQREDLCVAAALERHGFVDAGEAIEDGRFYMRMFHRLP